MACPDCNHPRGRYCEIPEGQQHCGNAKDELVESVAKRLHDLMKRPSDWTADTPTIGGTTWTTHYAESAREGYRVHARELIALVPLSSAFERVWLGYGTPERVIKLGRVDLEFYPATEVDPAKIRVRHDCAAGDGKPVRSAPELWDWHTITNADDPVSITVTPSIACNFCDLHGWVTDGRWIDAG